MEQKIAKCLYEGFTGLPWPPLDGENVYTKEKILAHAKEILSLSTGIMVKEKCPLLDNGCTVDPQDGGKHCPKPCKVFRPLTLGELEEHCKKMMEKRYPV